jgi:hypothetical protein
MVETPTMLTLSLQGFRSNTAKYHPQAYRNPYGPHSYTFYDLPEYQIQCFLIFLRRVRRFLF